MPTTPSQKSLFERFLHSQSSSSIVLLLAAIVAVVWANSPWSNIYHTLSHLDIGTHFAGKQYHLTLDHWVKDGLMAIFFFVVGLEIKREIIAGELSSFKQASLPISAAIGGMVIPALLFTLIVGKGPGSEGWGIPMATDIAFSLGILSLLGKKVPISLKIFLAAYAIVDDIGAVMVIAIFYSSGIAWSSLLIAGALILFLVILISYYI